MLDTTPASTPLRCVLILAVALAALAAHPSSATAGARLEKASSASVRGFSGDDQAATVGSPLPNPLRVRVVDDAGAPVEGRAVRFRVVSAPDKAEGAAVRPKEARSGADGHAIAVVQLGDRAGEYVFAARLVGVDDEDGEVYFKATARKGNWVFLLVMGLVGGLALFLFGMEMMSEGMKKAAGNRMRSILAALTGNRVIALLVGAFVTMVIQSSSATTVMLVSFVQAQLMTFAQSLGVILGADIGTTITAQMIAFKLTDYALLMIAAGFLLYVAGRRESTRYFGETLLGFGILFFGMYLMSKAMVPLRTHDGLIDLLVQLENPLLGILVGAAFTALIQSSSAFTGIVIVLSLQGLLTLEAGIPLIFGANIGTCVTAGLASIKTEREAKRVALAHTLFKVVGVLLFVFWIPAFADLVRAVSPDAAAGLEGMAARADEVPRQVANAHTIFNVSLALVMLPFTTLFARLIERLLPERPVPEAQRIAVWHIDERSLSTPAIALSLARREVRRMMTIVRGMLEPSLQPFLSDDPGTDPEHEDLTLDEGFALRESQLDFLDEKITAYLTQISRRDLVEGQAAETFALLSIVKDLEGIGDVVDNAFRPLAPKKRALERAFSEEGVAELRRFHKKALKQLQRCEEAFDNQDVARARKAVVREAKYRDMDEEYRQRHFERIRADVPEAIATHEIHMELLDYYKVIHVYEASIARTLATSMGWEDAGKSRSSVMPPPRATT